MLEVGIHRTSHKPNFNSPDLIAECYGVSGEFSPKADEAFNKHIKRLEHLKKFFANENGNRIKYTLRSEKNWYPL